MSWLVLLVFCGCNAAAALFAVLSLFWWDRQDKTGCAGWKEVTSFCA